MSSISLINRELGPDGVRRYRTRWKILIKSHQYDGTLNISNSVINLSTSKTTKSVGSLSIALTAEVNILNRIYPNDYISAYCDRGDGQGWTRVFFGFVDVIEESRRVEPGTGKPVTIYTLQCSDFQKAIERTDIYFNPYVAAREDFDGSFVGTPNIGGAALRTRGLRVFGTPADLVLNSILLLLGYGAQFILPTSYSPRLMPRIRQQRADFILGTLSTDIRNQILNAGGYANYLESIRTRLGIENSVSSLIDPFAPGAAAVSRADRDRYSNTVASTLVPGASIGTDSTRSPTERGREAYNVLNTTVAGFPTTLLDVIDLFTFVERDAIDGYAYEMTMWERQGTLMSLIRSISNEIVNELFFDLRAVSRDGGLIAGVDYSRELDDLEGNAPDNDGGTAGILYQPAVVMREYPFSTIDRIDANNVPISLRARGANREQTAQAVASTLSPGETAPATASPTPAPGTTATTAPTPSAATASVPTPVTPTGPTSTTSPTATAAASSASGDSPAPATEAGTAVNTTEIANRITEDGFFTIGTVNFGAIFSDQPNKPGRHVITIPSLSPSAAVAGTSLSRASKHLDVAVVHDSEISTTRFSRSDTDHFNLFELISESAIFGESSRFFFQDLLPIITPTHIVRHGLRQRRLSTRFARFSLDVVNRLVPQIIPEATPQQQPTAPEPNPPPAEPVASLNRWAMFGSSSASEGNALPPKIRAAWEVELTPTGRVGYTVGRLISSELPDFSVYDAILVYVPGSNGVATVAQIQRLNELIRTNSRGRPVYWAIPPIWPAVDPTLSTRRRNHLERMISQNNTQAANIQAAGVSILTSDRPQLTYADLRDDLTHLTPSGAERVASAWAKPTITPLDRTASTSTTSATVFPVDLLPEGGPYTQGYVNPGNVWHYRQKVFDGRRPINNVTGNPIPAAGTPYYRFHNGVDIVGGRGTPIKAVRDGVVVMAAPVGVQGRAGYGNVVMIYHPQDNLYSLYAHLDSIASNLLSPSRGRSINLFQSSRINRRGRYAEVTVRAGDVIGAMGDSDCPGAVHLHFEFNAVRNGRCYPSGDQRRGGTSRAPGGLIRDFFKNANNTDVSGRPITGYSVSSTTPPNPNESSTISQDPIRIFTERFGLVLPLRGEVSSDLTPADEGGENANIVNTAPVPTQESTAPDDGERNLRQRVTGFVDGASSRRQLARWALLQDHWYQHNLEYVSGSIEMRGAPEIRVGYRLDLPDRNLSFYVEGVSHQWSYGQPMTTVLQVTRGQPNNPFPVYVLPPTRGFAITETQRKVNSRLAAYFVAPDPLSVRRAIKLQRRSVDDPSADILGVARRASSDTNEVDAGTVIQSSISGDAVTTVGERYNEGVVESGTAPNTVDISADAIANMAISLGLGNIGPLLPRGFTANPQGSSQASDLTAAAARESATSGTGGE